MARIPKFNNSGVAAPNTRAPEPSLIRKTGAQARTHVPGLARPGQAPLAPGETLAALDNAQYQAIAKSLDDVSRVADDIATRVADAQHTTNVANAMTAIETEFGNLQSELAKDPSIPENEWVDMWQKKAGVVKDQALEGVAPRTAREIDRRLNQYIAKAETRTKYDAAQRSLRNERDSIVARIDLAAMKRDREGVNEGFEELAQRGHMPPDVADLGAAKKNRDMDYGDSLDAVTTAPFAPHDIPDTLSPGQRIHVNNMEKAAKREALFDAESEAQDVIYGDIPPTIEELRAVENFEKLPKAQREAYEAELVRVRNPLTEDRINGRFTMAHDIIKTIEDGWALREIDDEARAKNRATSLKVRSLLKSLPSSGEKTYLLSVLDGKAEGFRSAGQKKVLSDLTSELSDIMDIQLGRNVPVNADDYRELITGGDIDKDDRRKLSDQVTFNKARAMGIKAATETLIKSVDRWYHNNPGKEPGEKDLEEIMGAAVSAAQGPDFWFDAMEINGEDMVPLPDMGLDWDESFKEVLR